MRKLLVRVMAGRQAGQYSFKAIGSIKPDNIERDRMDIIRQVLHFKTKKNERRMALDQLLS